MKKALVTTAAVLLLAGCGYTEVDIDVLEQEITADVQEAYDEQVNVDCPDQVDWETGETFTCRIEGGEGVPTKATAEMVDDDGNVRWTLG